MSKFVPTVVFDFDGVIHSYKSGWQGATEIPDLPVLGIGPAIASIRRSGYRVVVVSTRCATPEGIAAVEDYLAHYGITVDAVQMEKPPALCYVDDRAIQFDGNSAALLDKIREFKPWTEKPVSYWIVHTEHFAPYRRCSHCGFEMPLIAGEGEDKIVFKHCPECAEPMQGDLLEGVK